MSKKFVSILLILLLVGPYLGISSYLSYEKQTLKRAIKHKLAEGVDRSELIELSFSIYEITHLLKWEHAKEFEFEGQMYDVVESKLNADGSITYWCWWDHAETKLNKQLAHLLKLALQQHSDEPGSPLNRLQNILQWVYLPTNNTTFISIKSSSDRMDLNEYFFSIRSSHLEINAPPPDFV